MWFAPRLCSRNVKTRCDHHCFHSFLHPTVLREWETSHAMQKPVLTSNHRPVFMRQEQKRNKQTKRERDRKKERVKRETTCMHLIVHTLILHAARPPQRDVSGCSHVDSQVLASCYLPCTPPPTHQHGPVYSVASSPSRAPSSLDHRYSRKCMTGVADSL